MFFNVSKCKIIHTGNKNSNYKYSMGGRVLDVIDSEKDEVTKTILTVCKSS